MMTTLTVNETMQRIHGPVGQLEVVLGLPTAKPCNKWSIICHPHPLHGGTMNNKVVTTLAKTFQALGFKTIRFNFRGVGQSEGQYDQGQGELEDLMAVVDWVMRESQQDAIWLAGFSFGASIVAKAATQIPVNGLVTVAPPVDYFTMRNLPQITCPWILVQGLQDEVVPANQVLNWANEREPKPKILCFDQASHYFHGQLSQLRHDLSETLQGIIDVDRT